MHNLVFNPKYVQTAFGKITLISRPFHTFPLSTKTFDTERMSNSRYYEIKECFTKVKQVFLLYLWESLVTLELISLIPLVGHPFTDPLAVKLLDNRLFM